MADDKGDDMQAALAALQPEIRQMLAEDLPVDIQRCRDAYAAQRWGELREYVHRIKGTASFCRLDALKDICVKIEGGLVSERRPADPDMEELVLQAVLVQRALDG